MNYLECSLNLLIKIPVLIPLLFLCKKNKVKYVSMFIVISIVNELFLRLGTFLNVNWNWFGKLFSIIVSLLFLWIIKRSNRSIAYEDFNITRKANIKKTKKCVLFCISLLILILLSNLFLSNNYKRAFDLETLLFQATMPGLDEELAYRGIYLGLLNLAFIKRFKFLGTTFGWGLIITSAYFGLVHALYFSLESGLVFNAFAFVCTASLGFIFGLLAESSKNLLLPIVSHNTFNVINTFMSMMR